MTRSDSYPRSLVLLHWLVFAAAALAVAVIEIKGFFPKGSADRAQMTLWHESFGLAVLLLRVANTTAQETRMKQLCFMPSWQDNPLAKNCGCSCSP